MATIVTEFFYLTTMPRSYIIVLFLVYVLLIGLSVSRPKQFALPIFCFGLVVVAFWFIHVGFLIRFLEPNTGLGMRILLMSEFVIVMHLIAGAAGFSVRLIKKLPKLKRIISYFILFSLICISIVFSWRSITNYKAFYPYRCASNLQEMSWRLGAYSQNNAFISYEDIEDSEYDNWGRFLIAKQIKDLEMERRHIRRYLTCPIAHHIEQTVNDYWWADLSNEDCFPKNQLGPSVKPKTPIAGDHPDNHMDSPPLVLLKNGDVKQAKKGSKLWTRAYGEGNCLKPSAGN